jgi:cellulose synthase/poly-beta-1,6-N-acetylglucosamine synthase-like glycosyltransferase
MSPFLIISIVFSVLYCCLVIYFLVGWVKLDPAEVSSPRKSASRPFVSIIIPVRNEATHIMECLQAVLAQDYPQQLFEIIVIDDYSTDETYAIASAAQQENLRVLKLERYFGDAQERVPNKKKALTIGAS